LADRIERWIPLAVGRHECVDALISFLNTAPLDQQASHGLAWVAALVTPRPSEIAGHTYLLAWWLEQIRANGTLTTEQQRTIERIVDALVAAGDSRTVKLQKATEE